MCGPQNSRKVRHGKRGEEMDEHSWIIRAQEGDEEAFSLVVMKYDSFLKSIIAYYIHKNHIHDVAQEIWLLIYKKLWQLDDPEKIKPWIRKLVYHQCINIRKKLTRIHRHEFSFGPENWAAFIENVSSPTFSIPTMIEQKELRRSINRTLDELPSDYGQIIRLRYFRELNYEEIAALTGLSLSTVKWRIHQGKKLLKARLLTKTKRRERVVYDWRNE
jgi:RNA polymerase sigma-70 factor, ECF subfamily